MYESLYFSPGGVDKGQMTDGTHRARRRSRLWRPLKERWSRRFIQTMTSAAFGCSPVVDDISAVMLRPPQYHQRANGGGVPGHPERRPRCPRGRVGGVPVPL